MQESDLIKAEDTVKDDKLFMDLLDIRYSVRKFSPQEVEGDKINNILEAARVAPTACNFQPVKIYVLKSKEALEKLQKCKYSHFGETLAFIVCYDKDKCWKRELDGKLSGETDASIVTTHMMLEIAALGLGSTWIMHFIPEALAEEFGIPVNLEPVSILVAGYPSADAEPSLRHGQRKNISEIAEYI